MPNDCRKESSKAPGFLVAPVWEGPGLTKEESNRFPQAETRSSPRTSWRPCQAPPERGPGLHCPARGQLCKARPQWLPVSLGPGWVPFFQGSPAGSQVQSSSQGAGSLGHAMPPPFWPFSVQGLRGTASFFLSCSPRTHHFLQGTPRVSPHSAQRGRRSALVRGRCRPARPHLRRSLRLRLPLRAPPFPAPPPAPGGLRPPSLPAAAFSTCRRLLLAETPSPTSPTEKIPSFLQKFSGNLTPCKYIPFSF